MTDSWYSKVSLVRLLTSYYNKSDLSVPDAIEMGIKRSRYNDFLDIIFLFLSPERSFSRIPQNFNQMSSSTWNFIVWKLAYSFLTVKI